MTNFVINIVDGAEADVKAVLANIGVQMQPVEALAKGIGQDIMVALTTAVKQLPTLVLEIIEGAVPAVIAAAPTATTESIVSAIETSAISTLSTQGKAIADEDLVAFKGAVLATVATAQANAATVPAPAPEVTGTAEVAVQ